VNATIAAIAKAQEETLASVRRSQEAVVEAVGAWSKAVKRFGDELPAPKLEGFPTPEQAVESSFDFAQKLLDAQRDFATSLLKAAEPASRAARGAAKQ
jgi:hypothetical protein